MGYYANKFINAICQEGLQHLENLEVLSVHKILTEVTKKYMLTDLELTYLAHITHLLRWDLTSNFITKYSTLINYHCEHLPSGSARLAFFLSLVAYFVKKYIAEEE